MKKNKKQVIPKWFNGIIYKKGTTVQNPFSGEEYKLNALELSIYDMIVGSNIFLENAFENDPKPDKERGKKLRKITEDLYKGLDWFRSNNAKAYMVLLD